jgi:flagellar basal-body rod protein FlgC
MSVFDTLRIAASGLTAQRLRMDVAASNIANAQTTATPEGGPYRQESAFFTTYQVSADAACRGVYAAAVVTPNQATRRAYEPGNAAAGPDGYVEYPDIDMAVQMADLIGATRSYSLNSTVAQAAKQTALDSLDLGRG